MTFIYALKTASGDRRHQAFFVDQFVSVLIEVAPPLRGSPEA